VFILGLVPESTGVLSDIQLQLQNTYNVPIGAFRIAVERGERLLNDKKMGYELKNAPL
jgi:hypothetical protein